MTDQNWKTTNILSNNSILDGKWKVIRKISQGGFGQVYEVEAIRSAFDSTEACFMQKGKKFALKVESKQLKRSVLKFEYEVLKKFQHSNLFMNCFEYGEEPNFYFMVQTLGGTDLSKLIRQQPNKCLTFETAFRLTIMMLNPLEIFHSMGWVHRDIKCSNFVLAQNPTRVVLIDFGVCKLVFRADGLLKTATEAGKGSYQGTYFYSSLRAQNLEEPWKSDDLFSVYISILTMLNKNVIPWKNIKDRGEILEKKKKMSIDKMHTKFPPEVKKTLKQFYNHFIVLKYGEDPDYDYCRAIFRNVLNMWGVKDSDPFEWEEEAQKDLKVQSIAVNELKGINIEQPVNNAAGKSQQLPNDNNKNNEDGWLNKMFMNRFVCGRGVV